jgi:hypothetical protein
MSDGATIIAGGILMRRGVAVWCGTGWFQSGDAGIATIFAGIAVAAAANDNRHSGKHRSTVGGERMYRFPLGAAALLFGGLIVDEGDDDEGR